MFAHTQVKDDKKAAEDQKKAADQKKADDKKAAEKAAEQAKGAEQQEVDAAQDAAVPELLPQRVDAEDAVTFNAQGLSKGLSYICVVESSEGDERDGRGRVGSR